MPRPPHTCPTSPRPTSRHCRFTAVGARHALVCRPAAALGGRDEKVRRPAQRPPAARPAAARAPHQDASARPGRRAGALRLDARQVGGAGCAAWVAVCWGLEAARSRKRDGRPAWLHIPLTSPLPRRGWRTFKRPGVEDFIRDMAQVCGWGGRQWSVCCQHALGRSAGGCRAAQRGGSHPHLHPCTAPPAPLHRSTMSSWSTPVSCPRMQTPYWTGWTRSASSSIGAAVPGPGRGWELPGDTCRLVSHSPTRTSPTPLLPRPAACTATPRSTWAGATCATCPSSTATCARCCL